MTEQEWLDADSFWLLGEYLRGHKKATRTKGGRRKFQLFNCASIRVLFWDGLDENSRHLLEAFEQFSNGEIDKDELHKARIRTCTTNDAGMMLHYAMGEYAHGIYGYIRSLYLYGRLSADTARHQCRLLRDIFGNPFRPIQLHGTWQTATTTSLAQRMYDDRDFTNMPILGDALEEAGCADADVLRHCREEGGVHVKGCWVVDEVLGRE